MTNTLSVGFGICNKDITHSLSNIWSCFSCGNTTKEAVFCLPLGCAFNFMTNFNKFKQPPLYIVYAIYMHCLLTNLMYKISPKIPGLGNTFGGTLAGGKAQPIWGCVFPVNYHSNSTANSSRLAVKKKISIFHSQSTGKAQRLFFSQPSGRQAGGEFWSGSGLCILSYDHFLYDHFL